MADPNIPPEKCIELFRKAVDAHVKYISDASEGRGVDRHLFGLKKCLREGEELPALFRDRAYGYSGTWFLSTSQLSSEFFNGYGWSQVVDEGWGIAYMINENRFVSSLSPFPSSFLTTFLSFTQRKGKCSGDVDGS